MNLKFEAKLAAKQLRARMGIPYTIDQIADGIEADARKIRHFDAIKKEAERAVDVLMGLEAVNTAQKLDSALSAYDADKE